jgi:hypothetical protein
MKPEQRATVKEYILATPDLANKTSGTDTTCYVQGTAGIGSGDLQLNGTITSGQTVTISSFTLNAANT